MPHTLLSSYMVTAGWKIDGVSVYDNMWDINAMHPRVVGHAAQTDHSNNKVFKHWTPIAGHVHRITTT